MALAVSGSDLYAGGFFTRAGGNAANFIAKWDGNDWSALGSGMDSSVAALAVWGSAVYAGGFFTTAGGNAASRIAKWDGANWSALGSGMTTPPDPLFGTVMVAALAVSGSDLYAGGYFTTAGGKVSPYLARAILSPPPVSIITTNASFGISNGVFGFNLAGTAGQTVVTEAATNLANPIWMSLETNTLTSDLFYFNDPQWSNFPGRFYRVRPQ